MGSTPVDAIEAIQAMLAPAVAISAVGLLLLSMSNRYSAIINRIRLLNDEKRKYMKILGDQRELPYTDNVRFMSVSTQTAELMTRSRLLRNGILSMQTAVGLFVLTSVAIGINLFVSSDFLRAVPLVIFIIGMIGVVIGIIFAALEVRRSYRIVLLEVKADE